MGGMRMPALEAEGLAWLVDEAQRVAGEVGGKATETSVLLKILRDELTRKKWPKAHLFKGAGSGRSRRTSSADS